MEFICCIVLLFYSFGIEIDIALALWLLNFLLIRRNLFTIKFSALNCIYEQQVNTYACIIIYSGVSRIGIRANFRFFEQREASRLTRGSS